MQTWTASRFRSSPALELRHLDKMPAERPSACAKALNADDFYGVLAPRVAGSPAMPVGQRTARLFQSLSSPSRIDSFLLDDARYREEIIDLVLDGVLEIEIGGAFFFGADAFRIVSSELPEPAGRGTIGSLSHEALQYAEAIETRDAGELASALYRYNSIPRSRSWMERLPDRDAVLAYIGAESGPVAALLDQRWFRTPPDHANGWISWQTRTPRTPDGGLTWKLYVSPRPEDAGDCFRALVRVLAEIPGSWMKIGPDAPGLLRPDKLVAYFATRDDLDASARALAPEIEHCPPQGVPFTAGIDDGGLLSWGVDPPEFAHESWRRCITTRLAAALAIAKNAKRPVVEPWRFAIERVRRHGVDVDTWAPSD